MTGAKIFRSLVVCFPMSHFIITLVNFILKQNFALQATWSTRPSQGARVSTFMRNTLV